MPVYGYLRGEQNPVRMSFKSGVAVQIGDLCFRDASDSYKVKPAGSLTWVSAVATPSAPTVTNTTTTLATGLTNAATGVKISYQFPWGEGTLSSAGSATPTAQAGLIVTGIVIPTPAIAVNVYVEDSAGSGTYKYYGQFGAQQRSDANQAPVQLGVGKFIITGYGVGSSPPTAVAQDATAITQFSFKNSFCGVAASRYDGTNTTAPGVEDLKCRINRGGIYRFACASASFKIGDLLGPAKQSGNLLEPQKVVAVTGEALAIGQAVIETSSQTYVDLEIFPTIGAVMS